MWLDNCLDRSGLSLSSELATTISQFNRLEKVVLPVFFGKVDACVISLSDYDIMCLDEV